MKGMLNYIMLVASLAVFLANTRLSAQPKPIVSLEDCILMLKIDSFSRLENCDSVLYYVRKFRATNSAVSKNRKWDMAQFDCYKTTDPDSAYYFLTKAIKAGLRCPALPCEIPGDYLIFGKRRNEKIKSGFEKNNRTVKTNKKFLAVVDKLIVYDQVARGNKDYADTTTLNADSLKKAFAQVDSINRSIIKPLIYKSGWQGITGLGTEGDINLWALVQHADNDVTFQQYVLKLLEAELLRNNTRKANYAYLYDRVCVNTGYPQLFGTQAKQADEKGFELHSLQDSINVDCYRRAFGLTSLDSYVEYFEKKARYQK